MDGSRLPGVDLGVPTCARHSVISQAGFCKEKVLMLAHTCTSPSCQGDGHALCRPPDRQDRRIPGAICEAGDL